MLPAGEFCIRVYKLSCVKYLGGASRSHFCKNLNRLQLQRAKFTQIFLFTSWRNITDDMKQCHYILSLPGGQENNNHYHLLRMY